MSFAQAGYTLRYMEWAKTVMEAGLPGVIDIGSSGIAPVTLRELGIGLRDLELFGPHFYGEPELRRRIARHAKVAASCVLPTLGASHAHFLICASLIEPGDEVIVEAPGYESLSAVPRALGARVREIRRPFENGFQFDPDELRRLVTRRTRLVIVTNPHNPSGVVLSPACMAALAECAGGDHTTSGHGGDRASDLDCDRSPALEPPADRPSRGSRALSSKPWVIVNEVYRDFVRRAPRAGHTLGPRAVSLGSLTKVYGLGETRVGWAVADPALVHRASRVNDFGPVNGPYIAERIGALALARRARLLARSRAILTRNQRILARFLRRTARLVCVPSAGGVISFPLVQGVTETSTFAKRALERKRVCVVPGEFFGAPGHIRIGIGTGDAARLEDGLRRLEDALRDEA